MSDTPELLPCPFCGGEASFSKTMDESLWSHDTVPWYRAQCNACEIGTGYVCDGYDPSAEESWNRRADRASRTPEPVGVPAGYALVPIEPTEAMGQAYLDAARLHAADGAENTMRFSWGGYRAMLAVTPAVGAEQQGQPPSATQVDTAPMYKALQHARDALCCVRSGAAFKALELIDGVLHAKPEQPPSGHVAGEQVERGASDDCAVGERTITMGMTYAANLLGALWHGGTHNPEAYERIRQDFARRLRGDAPLPIPLQGANYTHADVAQAHADGYKLGLAQEDRPTPAPEGQGVPTNTEVPGLGRMTDEDDGIVTLQFVDEAAAQQFMLAHSPSVEVDAMPEQPPSGHVDLRAAQPAAGPALDPKALGEFVERWTGEGYTTHRTDNGQPERWIKTSVERLGHAVAAALASQVQPAGVSEPFQQRVQPWMLACFGAEISADRMERNHRFFEESTELVQANGMTASEAHQLVDYTYGRPVGELHQEAGGVMVTLAALCLASGLDMHAAGETELARIWTKVDKIRAKQAAKPKHSPLPEAAAPTHPIAAPGQAEPAKGGV